MSYFDDTYLVVASKSYKKNCELLEEYFKEIQTWTENNNVVFEPTKNRIMHFHLSQRGKRVLPTCLPVLSQPALLKSELRILGIIVDQQLTWKAHVAEVCTHHDLCFIDCTKSSFQLKIRIIKSMYRFSRISTVTMGFALLRMRHFYVSIVLSKIAYACPAWFLNLEEVKSPTSDTPLEVKSSMSKGLIKQLKKLQRSCLVKIAGALHSTPTICILHGLHIPSIEMYLQLRSLIFQVRELDSETSNTLGNWRSTHLVPKHRRGKHTAKDRHMISMAQYHPLQALELEAREMVRHTSEKYPESKNDLSWLRMKTVELLQKESEKKRSAIWDQYCENLNAETRKSRPAVWLTWGEQVLDAYKNLDRAQSSILFQFRTGAIGLRDYLYRIHVCHFEARRDLRSMLIWITIRPRVLSLTNAPVD